jgi:hypothetical protein
MSRSCTRLVVALALVSVVIGCRRPGGGIIEVGQPTNWHTCPPLDPWPAPASEEIGSEGGTVEIPNYSLLTVPPNALPGNSRRTFTLTPIEEDRVGVEVTMSAQGRLQEDMVLEIETRCALDGEWWVWRVKPSLQNPARSEKLRTTFAQGRARVEIDTTSAFMIAN